MRDKLHAAAVIKESTLYSFEIIVFLQFIAFGSVCLTYRRQEAFEFVGRFGSVSLQTQKDDCQHGTAANLL
jgi:hypothetical protein